MKLTKADIENLAEEVKAWAKAYDLGEDWLLFYNGKRFDPATNATVDGVDPHDYSEWFCEQFIMGMAYDGAMYECINDYDDYCFASEALDKLLSRYGLYCERGDSCHCDFVWGGDDIEEVDYTYFPKESIAWIHMVHHAPDEKIAEVMRKWWDMSAEVGDIGACTLGQYVEFVYKGQKYRMSAQSPWQGDWSWRQPLPEVKRMLAECGATEIRVDYGHLD